MGDARTSEAAPAILKIWLCDLVDTLCRPLPPVINRDGETFTFSRTRFPVSSEHRDAVIGRLDQVPHLDREPDGPLIWSWLAPDDDPDPGDTSRALLGTVELTDEALVLTTNSLERAERGKTILAELLPDLAGNPLTELQTLEQLITEDQVQSESGRVAGDDAVVESEELEALVRQTLDREYRKALDEPVPMLGNKTPRQCARSKAGRAKLREWLKYLENMEHKDARTRGTEPYDFGWLWEELKLDASLQ